MRIAGRGKVQVLASVSLTVLLVFPTPFYSAIGSASRAVLVDRGAQDPAVSPDGNQIAVGILGKIWLLPIRGGRARQVTFGSSWDAHPAWSPDGKSIAYALQQMGRTDLVILDLATTATRPVYTSRSAIGQIAYHPSNAALYFVRDLGQCQAQLWVVGAVDSGAAKRVFSGAAVERAFAIAPNGKELAVEQRPCRGPIDIYRMSLDSGQTQRVTSGPGMHFGVQWSADGTELFYIERIEGVESVVRHPVSDSAGRVLFTSVYDGKQIAASPSGTGLILLAARRLQRLDVNSGRLSPIPFTALFQLPALGPSDLTITNARLFDGIGRGLIETANVEIRGGRIARVWTGPWSADSRSRTAVLDAHGQVLMAGLVDNHFHYWQAFDGNALLASGITAMRDPGSDIAATMNMRDALRFGMLDGPEIFPLGPIINGPVPVSHHATVDVDISRPEAAAPLVARLKALGVDGLKVYEYLRPEVLRAVMKAAREHGLPVTGHVGLATMWDDAIAAGINGLNHAPNYREMLLPIDQRSFREGDTREVMGARRQATNSVSLDPDVPVVDSVIHQMAIRHVALDPTLIVFVRSDSSLATLPLAQADAARKEAADLLRFVRKAYDAGVPLLAGTDNTADLVRELELYERAGVPRAAILQAATINGLRWLGKQGDVGTIEPGRRANLILVDGNPLEHITDLRRVSVVIKDGRVVSRR